MRLHRLCALSVMTALAACAMLVPAGDAGAKEVQLAGIRLGQHAIHVMQVYGQPDGAVKGGAAAPAAAAGLQAGMEAGEAAMPGGMPGGMPGAMPGAGMPAAMPGGPAAGEMGAMPGAGPGAEQQVTGAAAVGAWPGPSGGGPGAAPPGPNPFPSPGMPDWAHPVWVPMMPEEALWVYRRGPVVLGFVFDRDGYVVSIAVAGEKCDWARTAMGDPHRQIKLGDDYRRVVSRYGYPAHTRTYNRVDRTWASTLSLDAVRAGFGGIGNASRDLILHYGPYVQGPTSARLTTQGNNIEFTLRDMKVVRMHIWEPEARPPAPWPAAGTAAPGVGVGVGADMGPGMMQGVPGAQGMPGPAGP